MSHSRDLYKTKLCTLYQQGNCPRQSCSFAHGDGELRRFPSAMGMAAPFSGSFQPFMYEPISSDHHEESTVTKAHNSRTEAMTRPSRAKPSIVHTLDPPIRLYGRGEGFRSGDLRERLERRRTPPLRRRSPLRDIRSRPAHYGRTLSPRDRGARSRTRTPPLRRRRSHSLSAQRSPPQKRRDVKRSRHDNVEMAHFSDVSGEGHGTEDVGAEREFRPQMDRTPLSTPNDAEDTMENQLRQIQSDYDELLDEKAKIQHSLEESTRESSVLLAQNQELESRLHGANDDYKRLGSKMKSFLKYFARYIRAKDVALKTRTKLQQLANELSSENGENTLAQAPGFDVDAVSDDEPQPPNHHVAGVADGARAHGHLVVNHIPVPTAGGQDDRDMGALVVRRAVPTFVPHASRGSEEKSETHEDGVEHSGSKLQATMAIALHNNQRVSNRLVGHQNGYMVSEVDDGDWSVKPSVRLSLAATDKSEKDEVKEDFFVPLESKAGRQLGAETPMSSRSPTVDKVKVREVFTLPPTTLSSQAREFDLERRKTPQRGSTELNGPDGEGVNVSLSLSSRAYRLNGSEPLGSLLPQSLSISSSHYGQYKRQFEDLDISVGESGDRGNPRELKSRVLHVESSLQT